MNQNVAALIVILSWENYIGVCFLNELLARHAPSYFAQHDMSFFDSIDVGTLVLLFLYPRDVCIDALTYLMPIIQMYLPVSLFVNIFFTSLQLLHYLKITSQTEVMRGNELRVLVG